MPPGRRSLWAAAGSVAYVSLHALRLGEQRWPPLLALIALPLLLVEVWRRSGRTAPGEQRIEAGARSAQRACFWGAALWLAARSGPSGSAALDAAANLGAGAAAVGALVALARVASLGGLLKPHPATRSLDAAAFAALLWSIALAIPATRAFAPVRNLLLDPLAIDYATTTAGVGSLLVLIAAAWRLRVMRRLEIGVGDRAAGALALSLTAFFVAIPSAAADIAPPDRVLPAAVIAASLACAWTATTPEPTTVSTSLRGIIAVMMLGVPTTLLVAVAAREAPHYAGPIALAGCLLAIVVGLIAHAVARPLGPEQSRWLEAVDAASRGALQPEPDAAIQAALMALRRTATTPDARPELWRNDPPEVLSVDIAGYLHVERGEAPQKLYEAAADEPERTLRAEALRALEVRRPDLRPLIAWFETRRAFSATLVVDEDGPIGFILLPRGARRRPMTLEEARAVRVLADRISALLAVSSALARSRKRQLEAERHVEQLDQERERLEGMLARGGGRNESFAELLARPVRVAAYSPASQLALAALERLAQSGKHVSLLAPLGVDPVGWAALAHLASPRKSGPLVVVDAASSSGQSLELYSDKKRSPVMLADGGTLIIVDVAALSAEAQGILAAALSRRTNETAASNVAPAGLIAVLRQPLAELVEAGRLVKSLASLLADSEVKLPALAERGEDLRALVLDGLSALGMRLRGEPMGVDPAALALLVDHTFPGNDAELRDLLSRAAQEANGPTVTAADLAAVGFRQRADATPLPTPAPLPAGRRPRLSRGVRRG